MKLCQRIIINGLIIAGLGGLINYKPSNASQINYESKSNILKVSNSVYKGLATADVGGRANTVGDINKKFYRSYKGLATADVGGRANAVGDINKEN